MVRKSCLLPPMYLLLLLFIDVCVCVLVLAAQSCPTLCDPVDCSLPSSDCPWDFPGKHTGVGSHSLLQRIFSAQVSNPGLLHCRQILYQCKFILFCGLKSSAIIYFVLNFFNFRSFVRVGSLFLV